MISNIQNSFIHYSHILEAKLWNPLTASQKKVAVAVAAIFALIAVSYAIFKCYPSRMDIHAKKLGQDEAKDVGKQSPIEDPAKNRIPSIGGYGFIDKERASCKRLFEMLYESQFNFEDKLARFLKLTSPFKPNYISVSVDITDHNPRLQKEGCIFHTYTTSFYATRRELVFSERFLKTFDELAAIAKKEDRMTPELKEHLQKVIDQIEEILRQEDQ